MPGAVDAFLHRSTSLTSPPTSAESPTAAPTSVTLSDSHKWPNTGVRIGYARCSTATQELQSQLDALESVCFEVFHEKVSTRVKVWPPYKKAVAMARRF
ncbi:recombinase family protein [Streptomyces celluloflavus]|uniref:recombinase family protein n=1 Tax=Streptomyces celluloflavus TaxID=58344 RepID=UPI0037AE0C44